jgi:hypothetical protein
MHSNNRDLYIKSYMSICKNYDGNTVNTLLDNLDKNYDTKRISRNTSMYVNTVDAMKHLHSQIGGGNILLL